MLLMRRVQAEAEYETQDHCEHVAFSYGWGLDIHFSIAARINRPATTSQYTGQIAEAKAVGNGWRGSTIEFSAIAEIHPPAQKIARYVMAESPRSADCSARR
jgi:hypothetical protein